MPESAYGPTNNCVGIANVLRQRGHRVVFAAEASWRGKLAALGFEEDLVDLAPPAPEAGAGADPGQYWKDFIRDTAPEFRKPTIEQLETVIKPIWDGLIDGAKYCEPQLKDIIARARPDVIIEDNVIGFPALVTAGVPFVRIVSCNPLEVKGPGIAPAFSGYAASGYAASGYAESGYADTGHAAPGHPAHDPPGWAEYRAEYERVHRGTWTGFNAWWTGQGAAALPDLEFIGEGDLNLYVYPEEADYTAARPLGPSWHRLDSSVRETDERFDVPPDLGSRSGALVYLSLGSLGSADVELMRRLVGILAETQHRYIVSKGPLHAELELPANMWGAEFVPQASVIPQADLVITHAGNNTTTEALHFGKPMICLPLFWDQYDNAQRIAELGFGVRLDPYRVTAPQLRGAVERLLSDAALRARMAELGQRIRARDGVRRGAGLIEKAAG